MSALRSPAVARNRKPLLEVLRELLPASARVLELGSGSGEHALYFTQREPGWIWQPSDPDPAARASITAYREQSAPPPFLPPLDIDATASWQHPPVDAVFSANMVHIAAWPAVSGLFAGAARVLSAQGKVILYGPFRFAGRFTAPSNAEFDVRLRARDPDSGVRDTSEVELAAQAHGFECTRCFPMPANNHVLVFTAEVNIR
jgi:cyclopropane fatty-acyl-phospholipid synthase-like methyltransferase